MLSKMSNYPETCLCRLVGIFSPLQFFFFFYLCMDLCFLLQVYFDSHSIYLSIYLHPIDLMGSNKRQIKFFFFCFCFSWWCSTSHRWIETIVVLCVFHHSRVIRVVWCCQVFLDSGPLFFSFSHFHSLFFFSWILYITFWFVYEALGNGWNSL